MATPLVKHLKRNPTVLIYLLPFASSLLLAVCFLSLHTGWLSCIALVPLFYSLEKMVYSQFKHTVLVIWLSGLLFFLIQNSWMGSMNIGLGPYNGELVRVVAVGNWFFTSLMFSITYLLLALIVVNKKWILSYPNFALATIPLLW